MSTKLGQSPYSRAFLRYGQYSRSSRQTVLAKAKSTLAGAGGSRPSKKETVLPPPHSMLPNKMLLRGLLVATVSSHSWLLRPALWVLSMLNRPRISLLDVDRNPVLRQIVKKTFYNHFCAGENGTEVRGTIGHIKDMGFKGVILTYAKEIFVDASAGKEKDQTERQEVDSGNVEHPDITAWSGGVLQTVEMVDEGDILALKLTGAGAPAMQALSSNQPLPEQMMVALRKICSRAVERKARIFVDAEQQSVQKGIDAVALDLMRKYNKGEVAVVYNTYQAYLKSTSANLLSHMDIAEKEGFTIGVKLVRGAYIATEPRALIHDTKTETDNMYNSIAEGLIRREYGPFGNADRAFPPAHLFLATHNKESVLKADQLIQRELTSGRPATQTQYGQLLGMADGVSCRLLQLGKEDTERIRPEVFKCLSWGMLKDCLSYLLRRAVENRDAVERTREEYLLLRKETLRRLKRGFM